MKFSQPNITDLEISMVTKAIQDGHLVTGVLAQKFEDMFKDLFGYKYVAVTNSGTSALHLSLLALGVGVGDEVIVTPYSMVASVNSVLATGATPVFCDVDRYTYNIDPRLIGALVTSKTKAILPVSIFGVPCDIASIRQNVPQDIPILEDSIEALGAKRNGAYIGQDVEAATFGFFPNKQITTCEGGVVVSDNEELVEKVRALTRHGVMGGNLSMQSMGYNMRLSDVHCAMGIAQLTRFDEIYDIRRKLTTQMDMLFGNWRIQKTAATDMSVTFVYNIEVPDGISKQEYIDHMGSLGVPVKPYFDTLHTLDHLAPYAEEMPVADIIGSKTVALPFHHEINSIDIIRMFKAHELTLEHYNAY